MKTIKTEKHVSLYDVMICPNCGSNNCYEYEPHIIEFGANGNGHYSMHCTCNECLHNFRLYTEFEYSIEKSYTKQNDDFMRCEQWQKNM